MHQTTSVEVKVQYPSVSYQIYSLWADVKAFLLIRNLGSIIGMVFVVRWPYHIVGHIAGSLAGLVLSLVCQWKLQVKNWSEKKTRFFELRSALEKNVYDVSLMMHLSNNLVIGLI